MELLFTGDVFMWGVIFAALAVGITLFIQWSRRRGIRIAWYDWLMGLLGLALFLFTVQNFVGSFLESEPQAGWMFLLFPGLPSLMLIGIAALAIWRRSRAAA